MMTRRRIDKFGARWCPRGTGSPLLPVMRWRRRRGVMVIYLIVMMTALMGFASLAVDWGHVQLVKTELQQAADAAVRYGAAGLDHDAATGRANAIAAAADNSADGTSVAITNANVQFGTWNSATKTFTVVTGAAEDTATAIRVTIGRNASSGNAVKTTWGAVLGRATCDVNVTAIATIARNNTVNNTVPATSNPWLAGMPAGTVANPGNPAGNPDYAGTAGNPRQSPQQVSVSLNGGDTLTFDSVNGGANNFQSSTTYNGDGNLGWIVDNFGGSEHGMSDVWSPINAVIGVFLDDSRPDQSAAPAVLDFSSDTARDFQVLRPALKQVFFIGDGRRSDGSLQQFVIPAGATRFYIGTMDGYEWNNNTGSFSVTTHRQPTIKLVQ